MSSVQASDPAHSRDARLFPGDNFWVGAIILTMPVRELSLGQVGPGFIRLGDLVLAGAVLMWVLTELKQRGRSLRLNALDGFVVLFLALYILSILWSDQFEWGVLRLAKLTRNTLLYLLLVQYLRQDIIVRFTRLAMFFVASGVVSSLAYLVSIQQAGGTTALGVMFSADTLASSDERLTVVKGDQGAGVFLKGVASWLPLCSLLGVTFLNDSRRSLRALGTWLAIGLMVGLTLLTMTRAAWIALVAAVVVTLLADVPARSFRRAGALGLFVAILGLVGLGGTLLGIANSRFTDGLLLEDQSVQERLTFFAIALERFTTNPIFGGGVASIDPAEFLVVHNAYLQVLGELGLVGAAVFLVMLFLWVYYLFAVRRHCKRRRDRHAQGLVASVGGATAFFLVYFLAGHDLGSGEPWIVLALASALYSASRMAISANRGSLVPPPAVRRIPQTA
ncbi:MAG: O-antigen ligase family protein [Vicinamibacterales bacterium]